MTETKRTVMVECRATNSVVYRLPDFNNARREFNPGEKKKIAFDEIEALSYSTGGKSFIVNFLRLPVDVLEELDIQVSCEYHYTDEQVESIVKNGTLEQFQDLLEFAPEAIRVQIKKMATALPLSDINKCQAIKEILGFDVMSALRHQQAEREAEQKDSKVIPRDLGEVKQISSADGRQRRTAPLEVVTDSTPQKKKVVSSSPAN